MADVFISYKSDRRSTAEQIARILELHGFSVWFDRALVAGEEFSSPIERELRAARAVVVLWCSLSVGSEWVREEATVAKRLRTMIPVRLEQTELPLGFSSLQTLDFSRWQGAPRGAHVDRLVQEVARLVGREPRPNKEELGAMDAAAAATQEAPASLALALSDGPASPPAALAPPSLPDRPSLAVLPFRQITPDADDAYLAEGVVDEIIHALGGLKQLFVISRTSTLGYSGTTLDVRGIGRDLGVRYVLHGSIQRRQNKLRISTELSDALTGQVIRSDRYDGDLDDVFELQASISLQVLRVIAPEVREHELQRAQRKPPDSLTAYERVLQAQSLLDRMEAAAHARAELLLREAIALDPNYAAAYTALAYRYIFRVGEGWSADPIADSTAAAEAARTAMDLDGNDAMAVAIYAYVLSYMHREHDRALMLHEKALDICPNSAGALTLGSATAGFVGNGPLAVERALLGLRLSPLDAHVFWHEALLAQAHYIDGNFEEAVNWSMRCSRRNNPALFNLRTLAASLVALGRLEDAAQASAKLLRMQPGFSLAAYRERCPFVPEVLDAWMERLRLAGLPA